GGVRGPGRAAPRLEEESTPNRREWSPPPLVPPAGAPSTKAEPPPAPPPKRPPTALDRQMREAATRVWRVRGRLVGLVASMPWRTPVFVVPRAPSGEHGPGGPGQR